MTADAGELALTARNASIEDLVALLRGQQARKVDVVAPASAIRAENGLIVLDQTAPVLTDDGVTMTSGAGRSSTSAPTAGTWSRRAAALAGARIPPGDGASRLPCRPGSPG